MMYLVGGRGRLGQAVCASRPSGEFSVLDRTVYEDWWRPGAAGLVEQFFSVAPARSVVLVTAGLLDPALSATEHRQVNVDLPKRIIEGACRAGLRVVTCGTVMERLTRHPNPYIASKAELGLFAEERAAAGDAVLHLQIHTLYGGGVPAPFMFLGQLFDALRHDRPFEMSPGRQLREYHHVEDEAVALHALVDAGAVGVMPLSHGAPVTLAELATHVFDAVGRPDLLRIGARPEPPDDNYATVLPRPGLLEQIVFRPALQGVAAYVQAQLSKSELQKQA
ncbi:NAD-dependent epimerase/dehydratase family protein [Variovorax sp. W6]|uniref:NAD-dependent epimerase/dehydratase family protein n=1 Tax=Variovorax sp. W6 TaxID=3093895 RepID=UPI003D8018C5